MTHRTTPTKTRSVRSILLRGVIWRIVAIETGLMVWSVGYRCFVLGGNGWDLVAYAGRTVLLTGAIVLFIVLSLRGFLARKIIHPLEAIATANRLTQTDDEAGRLVELAGGSADGLPKEIADIVTTRGEMLSTVLRVSEERLRLTEFIRTTFGRYLSDKVVDEILSSPDGTRVGGRRETVTILMADLRGFTGLTEHRNPEEVFEFLNRHLSRMSDVILEFDGTINDFVGDEIMAVFGMPDPRPDDSLRATACAVAMQNELVRLNRELAADGLPELTMGIGLNTGPVLLGNIGSDKRLKYGVVGSAVNTAARIQADAIGSQVLLGQPTYDLVKEKVTAQEHHTALMKGLSRPVLVHSVAGVGPPYDLTLIPDSPDLKELSLNGSCRWWRLEGKRVVEEDNRARPVSITELEIKARIDPPLPDYTDLKLDLTGCLPGHEFKDVYAKVVGRHPDDPPLHRLRITGLAYSDRRAIRKMTG